MKNILEFKKNVKLPTYCEFCFENHNDQDLKEVFLDNDDPSTGLKLCKRCEDAFNSMSEAKENNATMMKDAANGILSMFTL